MKFFGGALVFVAELGMYAGLAWWGWQTGAGALAWVLAIGIPLVVAVLWGLFLSPRATKPLKPPLIATLVRVDLLLVGAAAAWAADARMLAIATATFGVVGTILARGAEQDLNGPPGQH